MTSSMIRTVKNVTKGYSPVQVKVRNATSNDPWGPTGGEMADIARMTYNSPTDFYEVMDMLDKRLNDKGKNWRHVLKSLKVLDYCLHEGSDLCVTWARKNIYIIRTLREFVYVDEDGKDVGENIRFSAKELTALIMDEERLKGERTQRNSQWKSRVNGVEEMDGFGSGHTPNKPRRDRPKRQTSEDDLEYKLALEASKNAAEEDARRRAGAGDGDMDDDELAKAIRLSKEEEELRRRELEQANATALFDDTPISASQPTGYNQGYQQQAAVDWFGNPMEQQPQSTGYLNNMYGQQGLQPQQTAYQPNYNSFQQPQQTGYMQQMQAQPTGYNPWATNTTAQPPQQQVQPTGSNNPWAQTTAQQTIAPQPTGSNNPFASASRPQQATTHTPSLSTLQEQRTAQNYAQPTYNPIANYQPSQQTAQQPVQTKPAQQAVDPHHAQLNALLASGAGLDTYGNVGEMRVAAQHTAPGTFVNSAGQGLTQLEASRTGTNPFMQSQFTGMAATQYPAQTGPARAGQTSNPYGGARQQGAQGSSLIDL